MTPSYPLSLLSDGATWRGRALSGRTLDLLAALAGSEGARMGDDAIIEALWPADPPAHPLRALHVVVSRARAAVGEDVVERVGDGYRLALATSDVDARDLAARAARLEADPTVLAGLDHARRLVESGQTDVRALLESLTAHEHEVLVLLTRGLSTSAIVQELSITQATLHVYIRRIRSKLKLKDHSEGVWGSFPEDIW